MKETCLACNGRGTDSSGNKCNSCNGTGTVELKYVCKCQDAESWFCEYCGYLNSPFATVCARCGK